MLTSLDRTATDIGTSADQLIAEFAPEVESDLFWRVVDTNNSSIRIAHRDDSSRRPLAEDDVVSSDG